MNMSQGKNAHQITINYNKYPNSFTTATLQGEGKTLRKLNRKGGNELTSQALVFFSMDPCITGMQRARPKNRCL